MMPIINIHPLPSEEKAESFRLTLKDADKFGLYCCHDGTSAMWSVIPKIALQLIFNAETALPVTERSWVGLTDKDIDQGLCHANYAMQTAGAWRDGVEWAIKQLQERNT